MSKKLTPENVIPVIRLPDTLSITPEVRQRIQSQLRDTVFSMQMDLIQRDEPKLYRDREEKCMRVSKRNPERFTQVCTGIALNDADLSRFKSEIFSSLDDSTRKGKPDYDKKN